MSTMEADKREQLKQGKKMTTKECDAVTRKFEKRSKQLWNKFADAGIEEVNGMWWEDAATEMAAEECGGWDFIERCYEGGE